MDWMVRAVLTALTVGAVLLVAERFGQLIGGFCAALPTVTAPALGWLAHDRGAVFASQVAVAGVASCAMLAAFAFAYVRAPRRKGSGFATAYGVAAAAAMAAPVWYASQDLMHALALSTIAWLFALRKMPRGAVTIVRDRRRGRSGAALLLIAAAAAVLSATATVAGQALGTFAAGLLSSLPFISAAVAVVEHTMHGPDAAATFLRGYVDGLPGKAAFGALFAWFAVPAGSAFAMALAFTGLLALSLATRWLLRRPHVERPTLGMAHGGSA